MSTKCTTALTGFAKSSKFTALKTPVVLDPLMPSPGSSGLLLLVPLVSLEPDMLAQWVRYRHRSEIETGSRNLPKTAAPLENSWRILLQR